MDIKKYIIELEEMIVSTADGQMPFYKIKGFNTPTFDSVGVSKLTPYTEPDLDVVKKEAYAEGYKEGMQLSIDDAKLKKEYQRGLNDAWDAARKIPLTVNEGGLSANALTMIFGNKSIIQIFKELSASEVIEKIRQYEQDKKQINVWDEVQHKSCNSIKIIVLNKESDVITGIAIEDVPYACKVGEMYINRDVKDWEKTGKHYEIVEVLRKLREKES